MLNAILGAYDGSESATKAYLAKRYEAKLIVLSAARPEPPEDIKTEAMLESARWSWATPPSRLSDSDEDLED